MTQAVTENDFRLPEFRDANTDDYEFRRDGKIVRKDRWYGGFIQVVRALGINDREFEIEDVVERVGDVVEIATEQRDIIERLTEAAEHPDDPIDPENIWKVFCANCVSNSGNFEVSPGQALRIATLLAELLYIQRIELAKVAAKEVIDHED